MCHKKNKNADADSRLHPWSFQGPRPYLNAISVDKGYLLGINSIECYSFSIIFK